MAVSAIAAAAPRIVLRVVMRFLPLTGDLFRFLCGNLTVPVRDVVPNFWALRRRGGPGTVKRPRAQGY
jgi:hypothetical protein